MKSLITYCVLSVFFSTAIYAGWKDDGLFGATNVNEVLSNVGKISYPCKNVIFEEMFGELFEPYEMNDIEISIEDGNRYRMTFRAKGHKISVKGRFKHVPGHLIVAIDQANVGFVNVRDKVIDCFKENEGDGRFRLNRRNQVVVDL